LKQSIIRIFFLFLIATACEEKKTDPFANSKADSIPSFFSAIVAQSTPLVRDIEAPGTILAFESTNMQPEVSGRVISINFKEGSFVRKGTLLVKLFDADLQAQLHKLEAQLKVAEATAKRQTELLAINGTSQQDFDNTVLNVSNIKADMELLKVQISQTELRAPFDGKLGLRNISLGAYVTPANIITNIAQVSSVKLEFTVPEQYAAEMIAGKTVSISTANTRKIYYATILASENLISSETRNLLIRAFVKNPDNELLPGNFVQVRINVGNQQNAIMVPTQAVIPSTRNQKLIIVRQGKAVMQNVNTGYRDSAKVEIKTGVQAGDTVVTSGLLTIKEGMSLNVKIEN